MMLKSICGVFLILSVNISDALKPSGKHPLHISSHAKDWCSLQAGVEHARVPGCLSVKLPKFFVEDEYIIILQDALTDTQATQHIARVEKDLAIKIIHPFFISKNFKGYGAKLNQETLRKLLEDKENVKYIECSLLAESGKKIAQKNPEWGLRRTVGVTSDLQQDYVYDDEYAGHDVDVYIIDSGIDTTHTDFEGRAKWGADLVRNQRRNEEHLHDLHGHGTHVAGIVMSKTYGVAKKATAIAVKIFGSDGSTTTLDVIRAIDFVVKNAANTKNRKSVINMSIGSPHSQAVDSAVGAALEHNIVVVAAAGNSECDACMSSPASAAKTTSSVTVMASDSQDSFTAFSNFGKCTTIIAPGENIKSTWLNNTEQSMSGIIGTSMAAPFVTGVVAKYLSKPGDLTTNDVKSWLTRNAVKGKIKGVPQPLVTPNLLLYYKDCEDC